MTLTNAVNKLSKAGFSIKNSGLFYWARKNNNVIDFYVQDGNIHGVRSRGINDQDDIASDYSAGVFCDNLSQAIRISN